MTPLEAAQQTHIRGLEELVSRQALLIENLQAQLDKTHLVDQHNPYTARELWPHLFGWTGGKK